MLLVRARAEFLCGAPIADVTGEAVDSADGWNMEHRPQLQTSTSGPAYSFPDIT